jgi:hypothetical protein
MSEEKQEVVEDQEVVVETPEEEPVKEAAPEKEEPVKEASEEKQKSTVRKNGTSQKLFVYPNN